VSLLDAEGDAEKERFVALLRDAERHSAKIAFWWRDDDAETTTPQLEMLLALASRHDLPLGLAVVPKGVTAALAARLTGQDRVSVLQHGWQHKRHSPDGEKKMELGDHRPLAGVVAELRLGFERLAALVPERFLPILVPPWNRIGKVVNAARHDVGLVGLSMFGPQSADDPHWVNTHLDIFDWQGTRGPLSRSASYAVLCRELGRRIEGDREPIGILTHHLIHAPESWAFLDELFALTAGHPAIEWPAVADLFALPAP
jgi:hypothetical protein